MRVGCCMDVERPISSGDALRRRRLRLLVQPAQACNLGRAEQQSLVGPAFGLTRGAHPDEAAAALQNLQALAAADGRDHGRLQGDVLPEV